jgi:hypothetical protein
MNKTSLITSAAGIALLLATAAPALAEDSSGTGDTSVGVSAGAAVTTGDHDGSMLPGLKARLSASSTVRAQEREEHKASSTENRIEKGQEKGANAIDVRIKSLQDLMTRLASIKKLPADVLASINTTLQAEIDKLVALKAQISADTATTSLKTDLESITKGNRVFLLVEPKARIASAASRIDAVVTQLTALETKFDARITAAQQAGVDVSAAAAAMTDLKAKLADAKTQADAAVAEVANLQVDNGDKTVQAANTTALKDAKAKLVVAQKDLAAARHDAATIYGVVKGKGGVEGQGSVHATTSTETH